MKLGTKGYDELAARRAEEIDQVVESLAQFASPRPTRVDVMFEHLFVSYALLRSRDGQPCRVLLGQAAYDKAKATGLIAWCREKYPAVIFEPPSPAMRGYQAQQVIFDEAVDL